MQWIWVLAPPPSPPPSHPIPLLGDHSWCKTFGSDVPTSLIPQVFYLTHTSISVYTGQFNGEWTLASPLFNCLTTHRAEMPTAHCTCSLVSAQCNLVTVKKEEWTGEPHLRNSWTNWGKGWIPILLFSWRMKSWAFRLYISQAREI